MLPEPPQQNQCVRVYPWLIQYLLGYTPSSSAYESALLRDPDRSVQLSQTCMPHLVGRYPLDVDHLVGRYPLGDRLVGRHPLGYLVGRYPSDQLYTHITSGRQIPPDQPNSSSPSASLLQISLVGSPLQSHSKPQLVGSPHQNPREYSLASLIRIRAISAFPQIQSPDSKRARFVLFICFFSYDFSFQFY